MVKSDNFVRLLLVEASLDDAELRVSELRNGGVAVRPTRAGTIDELDALLREQNFDAALVHAASGEIAPAQVVASVAAAGKILPVIVVLKELDRKEYFAALADGATGVAIASEPGDTVRTLMRALEDLEARRGLRTAESELRESERRCDALLESSRDPIAYVHEGMHLRANAAYLEIFGFDSFDDIEGMSLLDLIAPEHTDAFKTLLKSLGKGEAPPEHFRTRALHSESGQFDAVMEFQPATYESERCLQIVIRLPGGADSAELEKLRSHDLVTDLLNRQTALAHLATMSSSVARGGAAAAFWMIEPDHFRVLLGRVGLGNADLLLGDMAAVIRGHLEGDEEAARIGEHTFAILSPAVDLATLRERAEKLRTLFDEQVFEVGGKSLGLHVSIAVVTIGELNASPATILEEATSNLQAAREGGGNRVALHDPGERDRDAVEAENRRIAAVRSALENERMMLLYQSIVSLQGEEGEFFDVSVRLATEIGELTAGDFLPTAERFNLVPALDRWVIDHAIASLAERQANGAVTMFLRISPQSVEDASLLPFVLQCLKKHRVSGDRVVFQMVESQVVTHLKTVRAFTKGLEQVHSSFALARFGSGLDSFQTLRNIDPKYVKIDGALMEGFSGNPDKQQRVREICEQAHRLDKITVAEWVEDTATMALLFGFGVSLVQGNFLQEPEKVMSYDVR